ncbi:MAG: lytic murein transglycosylase [Patescibacteria group bacterium]
MTKQTVIAFFVAIFLLSGISARMVRADADCSDKTYAQNNESACRGELDQLLKDEADLEAKLKEQNKQTGTLKGDVTALTTQINALKTKIKARGLVIAQLKVSITEKVARIDALTTKIDREHASLAQLLRNTNEFDNDNLVHVVLSDKSISNFYQDLDSYASIKDAIKFSVQQVTGVKVETEAQKKDLETKKNAETDAQAQLQDAQKQVAQTEAEKKQLLAISKSKETEYTKLAAEKKIRAGKIKAALFRLRDTNAIPFSVALEYANIASQKTGVRPAFILGILTQESNLGTDQGSCYLTDKYSGAGISSKSGRSFGKVMSPTRDVPPFFDITSSLGLDPFKTLVSCPIGGYGWGGAMGPAQFIPSTWIGIANKVAGALGISSADPWEPRDAFMASGIFLADLGATSGSFSSEMRAACKYYGTGGSSCAYGRSVMKKTADIQDNINFIEKNK